jgi:hypothetical protein
MPGAAAGSRRPDPLEHVRGDAGGGPVFPKGECGLSLGKLAHLRAATNATTLLDRLMAS